MFAILVLLLSACTPFNEPVKKSEKTLTNFNEQYVDVDQRAATAWQEFLTGKSLIMANMPSDRWEKLRWVNKVFVVLRGGRGLQNTDDLETLVQTPKEQIIDQVLSDPEFGNSIFKFNLFFLGFYRETLKEQGLWKTDILAYSAALDSAKAVVNGEDYFRLFNAEPPSVVKELAYPFTVPPIRPSRSDVEVTHQQVLTEIDDLEKWVIAQSDFQLASFCEYSQFRFFYWVPNRVGLDRGYIFDSLYYVELATACNSQPPVERTKAEILDALAAIRRNWQNTMDHVYTLIDYRTPEHIKDMTSFDYGQIQPAFKEQFFNNEQALQLVNSSTNFNRKRSAYMLDRFLCDNLLPIDVALPQNHTGGSHGSDPACYSCHYRLDPMAGYFKNYGIQFFDFSNWNILVFDDGAQMDRETYQQAWKAEPGAGREWNIGVIRSLTDPSRNAYGESFGDLLATLKGMPEVHSCLTRRVFEFVTSPNQSVDQAYIEEVATAFREKIKTSSAEAIKYLFKTFVMSETFNHEDPVASHCYDFPSGQQPTGRPPCEVDYILQTSGHCAECHDDLVNDHGLDVTKWVNFGNNQFGFPHVWQGKTYTPLETFEAMKKAISHTDLNQRMPKDRHMDPTAREKLFLWLDKMIEQTGGQ